MSRGGSRGGGRGGGIHAMGWEDTNLRLNSAPSELFPPYKLNRPAPPTELEKREIAAYKRIQDHFHHTSLYTKPPPRDPNAAGKIYGEDQDASRYAYSSKADFDPFTGVSTYGEKYVQKRRMVPQFTGRKFHKELFPEELWTTLDGTADDPSRKREAYGNRKRSMPTTLATTEGIPAEQEAEKSRHAVDDRLKALLDEADGDEGEHEEEPALEEEDYDYEDDESEMGLDYDGEKYFDHGDKDEDGTGDAMQDQDRGDY